MGNATIVGGLARRPLSAHETLVRGLSERLVEAQRPLRILEAIQWDEAIERDFLTRDGAALPAVTRDYYLSRPLPFDPRQKDFELRELERDIRRRLGTYHAAGRMMTRRCAEYRDVVGMLAGRGTRAFVDAAERLYGSAHDCLHVDGPRLADLAPLLAGLLHQPDGAESARTFDARAAVTLLAGRLGEFFQNRARVRVKLSDGIVADATAGCDYIKIRRDARFSLRDLRLLEVHEGWVHRGTTVNGQSQAVCTFLAAGAPSSTVTQEGLAVLTEILAAASHPDRLRRLAQRIEGVALAEDGADFIQLYRHFLHGGLSPRDSYQQTMRIFRGSLPSGCGPFTKDLSYGRGLVLVYNFIQQALRRNRAERVPLLCCGKASLADIKLLDHLVDEGLVTPPHFLPPPLANLHDLPSPHAPFLDRLRLDRLEDDYAELLA